MQRPIARRLLLAAALMLFLGLGSGCAKMNATGLNRDGSVAFQQGRYQSAVHAFQQAIATHPTNPDAYYNLATTYHRIGTQTKDEAMLSQAENLYNQCLDLESDHVACHRGLAVLLAETDRPDSAFRLLRNWAAGSPKLADARIELARLYQEFGDLETAKLHLIEASNIDGTNARVWSALAHIQEASGDIDQALANYQRSYQLNTFQPEIASRISALQSNMSASMGLSTPGGTRMVQGTTTGIR